MSKMRLSLDGWKNSKIATPDNILYELIKIAKLIKIGAVRCESNIGKISN